MVMDGGRFFDQDVSAGGEGVFGKFIMGSRGGGDVDDAGAEFGEESVVAGEPAGNTEAGGGGFGHGAGEIADADDGNAGDFAEAGEVLLGDGTGADDGG